MIPVKLHLSGFLSYLDPVDIDFESFNLACISGHNGAGKSSILDAITWVLFGEARKRDDSIINASAEAAEVILIFDYEGTRYKVQRSKPRNKTALLEFLQMDEENKWHPLTEATLHATEEHIQHVLRLDYETFTNASFFLQGKADQFAQQRPADRKRILSSALGLEVWEIYKEEAFRQRREAENNLSIKDDNLNRIHEELNTEAERKNLLAQAEAEFADRKTAADRLKTQVDQQRLIQQDLDRDREIIEKKKQEILHQQQSLDEQNQTLLSRQQERRGLQNELANAPAVEKALRQWQQDKQKVEELDSLAASVQSLDAQRHPLSQRISVEQAHLETRLAQLKHDENEITSLQSGLPPRKAEAETLLKKIQQLDEAISQKSTLEAEIHEMVVALAQLSAENTQLTSEMKGLDERKQKLLVAEGAACPLCGQPLSPEHRDQLLKDIQEEGKQRGDRYRGNQQNIQNLEAQKKTTQQNLDALSSQESERNALQRQLDVLNHQLTEAETRLAAWQTSGAPELQKISDTLQNNLFCDEERRQLATLDEQIRKLGYDAAAHAALRDSERAGRGSQDAWLRLEKARSNLQPLEREIETLHTTITKSEEALAGLQAELTEAVAQLASKSAGLPDLPDLEAEFFNLQEQANQARDLLAARRNDVQVLATLKEQQKSLQSEKEELMLLISRLKLLEHAFGKDGIPAVLIEQALPEIQSDANDILDRLSDGNMSVRFETQREFKDKKREDRKETLDIIIHDGSGDRDYELFSGGEAFRINFAIRLALSRVLARRAGARLQTLVIDEGFGSQDAEGRQRLIEAINNVRGDFAKILVITHMEELKDAFSARIEVTKTTRGSRVEVIAA